MADNELISVVTDEGYIRAVNVTRSIIANAQSAQASLYEMCCGLKEARDGKLYKKLGYQNFDEYCEKAIRFSRMNVYRYISIVENLPKDFVTSMLQIGVTKLYLLSVLSDEDRAEITENTDLEAVSNRELEKQIKELRQKNSEQDERIKTLETLNNKNASELDSLARQRAELERQLEELENRPIDVAVSKSDSHEIENLKKAMKTCDKQWAEKYSELEEENIKFTRQIHQDYKAQIDQLTADYEKKLAEAAQSVPAEQTAVPDMKETFKAYYSMAHNSFELLVGFAKKQSEEDKAFCLEKTEKLINILKTSIQEV